MRTAVMAALALALLLVSVDRVAALKIDIGLQDVDRALVIARSREVDRAKFHAAYTQRVDTAFVESAEAITEFRRVVLLAEERASAGDRFFPFSVTSANEALKVWKRRVSIRVRVRLHPQNNYVSVPPIAMMLEGNERALIGVLRDPVMAIASGRTGEFVPLVGAVVEGVFEAEALGQGTRAFVISLEKSELARVVFDFGAIE